MKAYIYHIINIDTHKRYIGQTIDIAHRLHEHFTELKNGEHHSHKLQRSYNLHGEDKFKVEYQIVTVRDELELDQLEMKEIELYNSFYEGYNETLGGDGNKRKFSYSDSLILYNILQKYTGIDRMLGRYYGCDPSVFASIRENHPIFEGELVDNEIINKTIEELGLSENNLIENYIPHNKAKLNKEQCLEILSVIYQCEGYDKTICSVFNINSKLIWRLKQKLIYKDYIAIYELMTDEEKSDLKESVFVKYNLHAIFAQRKRAGTKDQLTQEQVNYILDHKDEVKTKIAKTLGVSVDRVRGIVQGKYYKDLIENYYSSKQ